MQAKELIKELDPDYVECKWCHRLVLINKTRTIQPGWDIMIVCLQYDQDELDT